MVIIISNKDTLKFTFFIPNFEANCNMVSPKKIVIAGGPGSGKTTLIDHLKSLGYKCYDEISREVTLRAREDGIEQLFLTDPLLFSQKLLEGRKEQFNMASHEQEDYVFLDRGLPDVLAYMDYIGDTSYPQSFITACETHTYDGVFMLAPWKAIFKSDAERYESFEETLKIHDYLIRTYQRFHYDLINIPFGTLEDRAQFVLEALNLN